jgi:hypothetical protein
MEKIKKHHLQEIIFSSQRRHFWKDLRHVILSWQFFFSKIKKLKKKTINFHIRHLKREKKNQYKKAA